MTSLTLSTRMTSTPEGAREPQQSSRFIQNVPWKFIVAVLVLLTLWFGIGQLCPPMYWRF